MQEIIRCLRVLAVGGIAMSVGCSSADTGNGSAVNVPVAGTLRPESTNSASAALPAGARPKFTTVGNATPGPGARTIPFFAYTETDPTNGVTYSLQMVGGDPHNGTTTTIPVQIVPLRMVFASGGPTGLPAGTIDGTARATATTGAPIFQNNAYPSSMAAGDIGQYGEVFLRAQANNIGSGYHVRLGAPQVLPAATIKVPQHEGWGVAVPGFAIGLVEIKWFSAQLQALMGSMQIAPDVLPIFITDNVMLYIGDESNCCVIGYHGAAKVPGNGLGAVNTNGAAPVNTYIYAAYTEPGTFDPSAVPFLQDIHALSHEVAEWLDDPFVDNAVQPWLTPTAPQYGCTSVLETGDPVVGIGFLLPGNPDTSPLAGGLWHPEDEVFRQWFLRENPSSAFNGNYTFMGPGNPYPGFHQPATGCN
jgi:hypothetical protein